MRAGRVTTVLLFGALVASCSGEDTATTASREASTTVATTTVTMAPAATPATTAPGTTETSAPPVIAAPARFDGDSLPTTAGTFFSASGACTSCHQQMIDGTGADVSIDSSWRSTMMANAARDPYWIATVRSEIDQFPDLAEAVEDKCTTCHMPMARTTTAFEGSSGRLFMDGFTLPGHQLSTLATDGVSCSLCHQVQPDGFGTEASFGGGFAIDAATPQGERALFGPYDSPANIAGIMQSVSGFVPTRGDHLQQSEMCGTCHTLYTPTVDGDGEIVGEFAEQTPYQEWEASAFAGTTSCQDCHLPEAAGAVQLSVTGGPGRSPFSQHHFTGGNTLLVSIFRAFGDDLGVTASSEHFDTTLARIENQLSERTATVAIDEADIDGGRLIATVTVVNLTGHKLPTAYPSRRAWLHATVLDGSGGVVFESGGADATGAIDGNANDTDPLAYEPHHERITDPQQVQIYEPIIGDTEGAVTTILLRGAGYLKDNRLLPAGFDDAIAVPDILPAGAATADPDFLGGSDSIVYDMDLAGAAGPFTIEVELLYQAIGYRWADNLTAHDGAEIARFAEMLAAVPNTPVRIASDVAAVGG